MVLLALLLFFKILFLSPRIRSDYNRNWPCNVSWSHLRQHWSCGSYCLSYFHPQIHVLSLFKLAITRLYIVVPQNSPTAIFAWPWKTVLRSVRYLFYQTGDEKIKTWTLRFPAKESPDTEKALFDWPVALQYDVKAMYRFLERSLHQPKATRVCIRSITNQIALFPFVCCFCFVRAFSFQGRKENRPSSKWPISIRPSPLIHLVCAPKFHNRIKRNWRQCSSNIFSGGKQSVAWEICKWRKERGKKIK